MLTTIDGKKVRGVPHHKDFEAVVRRMGTVRVEEVREGLNQIINALLPSADTNRRTFSSSVLGSRLTPWQHPIRHLYDVAREIEGDAAEEDAVQARAALLFGLFIWECVTTRNDEWAFYDPNLSPQDPNREIIGKVYFERGE